jgi:hypothetical protein
MNWKTNYWTLLFVLAALAFGYQTYMGRASAKGLADSGDSPYIIPDSTAQKRIHKYDTLYAPKAQRFAWDSCQIMNGGVKYFRLHKREIQAMADIINRDAITQVRACLSLCPGSNTPVVDTIDLIFEVDEPLMGVVGTRYYDFTHPCPPCETVH